MRKERTYGNYKYGKLWGGGGVTSPYAWVEVPSIPKYSYSYSVGPNHGSTTIFISSGSDYQIVVHAGIRYVESAHKIVGDGQNYAAYPNQSASIPYPLWYIFNDTLAYSVDGVFDNGSPGLGRGIGIEFSRYATVDQHLDGYWQADSPSIVKVHLSEPSSEDNHRNFFKFPLVL